MYLYKEPPGFRWPALVCDGYAYDNASKNCYGGNNPDVVMGSLLAVPPNITSGSLKIQTVPGLKIFHALQDYGGYMVSDTAYTSYSICVEQGVMPEFLITYGYNFTTRVGNWFEDIAIIFNSLYVVTNNAPNSIGGGGQPRQPLAPPITPPSIN